MSFPNLARDGEKTMNKQAIVTIDGKQVVYEGERNLLELVRKAGIDLPTFCYHSELSVYGACRLCIVDIEGRGVTASCSVIPEAGMVVRTRTQELREMRKITLELLLANHHQSCPTCPKNAACQLQELSGRLGVTSVRFKPANKQAPIDDSSPAIIRDPNKCVLCGDCVRYCSEVQSVGAIDFAHRGSAACVMPAFDRDLAKVECVNCGQCAAVCPTGALSIKPHVEPVWEALNDKGKTVVAQIAPAVRVALGEMFGLGAGSVTTGHIVAALKQLGFAKVFDTAFAADLTVIEEATEFLSRKASGQNLPQFTSCCPAWVKFAEQHYSDLLGHMSSCRSPQQMFGSLAKAILPEMLAVKREDLVVVSLMPCTAKKYEAAQDKFKTAGRADVDLVLTTQELGRMIQEAGIRFGELEPESLDMPLGFKTGAGVIFGASGGVSEAVLRYASEQISGRKIDNVDFHAIRGEGGLREATVTIDGQTLRMAVVHSLRQARQIADRVRAGDCQYDLIEVMACPGGCVGGAGQPVTKDTTTRRKRAKGLYEADKSLQLHKPQDNPHIRQMYQDVLGDVGSHKAHKLLHTSYRSRRRMQDCDLDLTGHEEGRLDVSVCVGTGCYVRGSQDLLNGLIRHIEDHGLAGAVNVKASFCFENCDKGPTVRIGQTIIDKCSLDKAREVLEVELEKAEV